MESRYTAFINRIYEKAGERIKDRMKSDYKGIKLCPGGHVYKGGKLTPSADGGKGGRGKTIAYGILSAHNDGRAITGENAANGLRIHFDALASHDITYVGIIQTARASGLEKFPIPYVLTNCHNSLCAVGGTINEDDHVFGLSAAKRYGGIYVPAHQAVIHSVMRECFAACGKMILGSDSHTRYGAIGTLAMGEGGPELVKQLLSRTYDIPAPEVIAINLHGAPRPGVGPQDVAIAIIGRVFDCGFVKNKVMEFVGEGIASLPMEFRNGIDVMTTETACLSSIWMTDEETHAYLSMHGREDGYKKLSPADGAYYDGVVDVDLSEIEPMIALPSHPSNAYALRELIDSPAEVLHDAGLDALLSKVRDGGAYVDQGVIAGCAGGTFDNLCAAADIIGDGNIGTDAFAMSAYPASQPVFTSLIEDGSITKLLSAGVTVRSAFCGPCFGAGDVPSNGAFSIRHTTRNFPNREGSKPSGGQSAYVALMDARSIAATAKNGGKLTSALGIETPVHSRKFDDSAYKSRFYNGFGKPDDKVELVFGPNITDWPSMPELGGNLLVKLASVIDDPVTTTDELIPSGETSSYRSNPLGLAEFALSRKDPEYVGRAKAAVREPVSDDVMKAVSEINGKCGASNDEVHVGSAVYAVKPGDGSAREQAASCQRVLGGLCNIAREYATKRYRSNLINWGMLPFLYDDDSHSIPFTVGDSLYVPGIRKIVEDGIGSFDGYIIHADGSYKHITLGLAPLTDDEKKIILAGCLINFYRAGL